MEYKSIPLLVKIVAAIGCGAGIGLIAPEILVRVMNTFCSLFSQLLGFMITLIIVGLVTTCHSACGQRSRKKWCERRCGRICRTSLCHNTFIWQYAEDNQLRHCVDADAEHRCGFLADAGGHIDAGSDNGSRTRCSWRSHHGSPWKCWEASSDLTRHSRQ